MSFKTKFIIAEIISKTPEKPIIGIISMAIRNPNPSLSSVVPGKILTNIKRKKNESIGKNKDNAFKIYTANISFFIIFILFQHKCY